MFAGIGGIDLAFEQAGFKVKEIAKQIKISIK